MIFQLRSSYTRFIMIRHSDTLCEDDIYKVKEKSSDDCDSEINRQKKRKQKLFCIPGLLRMPSPSQSDDEEEESYHPPEYKEWIFSEEELKRLDSLDVEDILAIKIYDNSNLPRNFNDKPGDKLGDKNDSSKFKCAYCNDDFWSKNRLIEHNKKRCVKEYRCKLCTKTFSRKKHYDDHVKMKKSCAKIIKDYKCNICNKKYATEGNIRRHKIICKEKNKAIIKKAKIEKIKVKEFDLYIKEYNNKDNKDLSKFDITESFAKSIREIFSIQDLDKVADRLDQKKCNKLVRSVIKKLHYSDDFPKGHNIRYISKLDKYIVYDGIKWKNFSSERVLTILQKEVEFVIYLATSSADIPGNKKFVSSLFENKKLLDEQQYKITQVNALKDVQIEYDERD